MEEKEVEDGEKQERETRNDQRTLKHMTSWASRLEVLLVEDYFRSFVQALELGDVLLTLQLSVTVLVLVYQFCVSLFDPP